MRGLLICGILEGIAPNIIGHFRSNAFFDTMKSVIWFYFQYLGGEFVGCLNDREQGTRANGMEIVLLHLLVVEGELPCSHVPANGEDFIVCQFQPQTQEHDDTLFTMAYGQVVVILLINTVFDEAALIAWSLADIVEQGGDNQRIV